VTDSALKYLLCAQLIGTSSLVPLAIFDTERDAVAEQTRREQQPDVQTALQGLGGRYVIRRVPYLQTENH
jgi:hypothetical protein